MAASEEVRWVVALTTAREDEAVFARGYLAAAGVDAIVEDAKFLHAEAGESGGVRLLVPEARAREARELLEKARRGGAESALGEKGRR